MYRFYWRPAGGGPERWAELATAGDVVAAATRVVVQRDARGGEFRLQSLEEGWTVMTTGGAIARWKGIATPDALAASGWDEGEALGMVERALATQLAPPLARAVSQGLLQPAQAERIRRIAAQAVLGTGPAGRDVDPDRHALAMFRAGRTADKT